MSFAKCGHGCCCCCFGWKHCRLSSLSVKGSRTHKGYFPETAEATTKCSPLSALRLHDVLQGRTPHSNVASIKGLLIFFLSVTAKFWLVDWHNAWLTEMLFWPIIIVQTDPIDQSKSWEFWGPGVRWLGLVRVATVHGGQSAFWGTCASRRVTRTNDQSPCRRKTC